jgi:hypothetical protein
MPISCASLQHERISDETRFIEVSERPSTRMIVVQRLRLLHQLPLFDDRTDTRESDISILVRVVSKQWEFEG